MQFSDIIMAVLIGVFVGFGMVVLYAWYLYRDLTSRIDRMIDEVVAEHEANMIGLDIELDNGTYFAYNTQDKQFICQGSTVGEIAVAFRSRYPTKTAYLAEGEPEVLDKFRAELDKMKSEVSNA